MAATKKRSSSRPKSTRKTPPIPVRAVDFVMYNTTDMRRTRDFYRRMFGFGKGEEWNAFWSEFATHPVTFCLNGVSQSADPKWNWQGTPCVALAVDDVPAAIERCRREGVPILIEPVETRVCWMAWIADPAGNRICLHARKDGSAG